MTQAAPQTPQAAPIHTPASSDPAPTTSSHPVKTSPALQAAQFQQALRFTLTLPHTESYYPTPRHKKTSERPAEALHTYFVSFTSRQEAPLVFVERTDTTTYAYRLFNGQLYKEAKTPDRNNYPKVNALTLETLIDDIKDRNISQWSLERNQAAHQKTLERFLVIAGRLYEKHLEPHYNADRGRVRIGYGMPDQNHSLVMTYNLLEFQAAYDLAFPYVRNRKTRAILDKRPKIYPHIIKVINPQAVQIPRNAELSQHFDNLEIQRGAVFLTEKLSNYGQRLRRRILERTLEMLTKAESSN